MKDSLSLLVTGLVVSAAAWAFWHYLGNDALCTITTVALVGLTVDNARLRRKLRAKHGR
jgi:hypothetical protein